jgi:hypothetical protein
MPTVTGGSDEPHPNTPPPFLPLRCRRDAVSIDPVKYAARRVRERKNERLYKQRHHEKILVEHRAYRAAHAETINKKRREQRSTPEGRKALRQEFLLQLARFPEKFAARDAVGKALRAGRLIRQPCEVCGAAKSEAHHDDYSLPLTVRWLCRKHHAEHHLVNQPPMRIPKVRQGRSTFGKPSPLRGIPLSEEHRQKLREAALLSNGMRGKKLTPQQKAEMSARRRKPVDLVSADGSLVKRYESAQDAAKELGLDTGAIARVCLGQCRATKGYVFRHASAPERS